MKKFIIFGVIYILYSCGSTQGYHNGYNDYNGYSSNAEMRLRALEEEKRRREEEERKKQIFMNDASYTLRQATKTVMEYLFNNIGTGRGDKSTLKSDFSERSIDYNYDRREADVPLNISWWGSRDALNFGWIERQISGYLYYKSGVCTFICTDAKNVKRKDEELIYELKTSGLRIK